MVKYTDLPLYERKEIIMPGISDMISTKYENNTAPSLLTAKAKIEEWRVTCLLSCDQKYKYLFFRGDNLLLGRKVEGEFYHLHPYIGDTT